MATKSTGIISAVAGTDIGYFGGDGGQAINASLLTIAVDASGISGTTSRTCGQKEH